MISEAVTTNESPTWKATYPIDATIISTHIEARPLKPSMMLMAFDTPVTTSRVNAIANGDIAISWSMPGIVVRWITPSSRE